MVERTCPAHDTARAAAAETHRLQVEARAKRRKEARASETMRRAGERAAARQVRNVLRAVPITELATMRTPEALAEVARRYARLGAWERDLSGTEFEIRFSEYKNHTSGHAYSHEYRGGSFVVTVGTDLADAHATMLHELAHVAAPRGCHHGAGWRMFFLAAVSEVIGRRIELSGDLDIRQFHNALARELALHLYAVSSNRCPPTE